MPKNSQLQTLKDIHLTLTKIPATKRGEVLTALGVSTLQTFYDVLHGTRKLNDAEKKAIANIYGKTVEEIDWQDQPVLIG